MKRVRGLSNERYAERKDAITAALRKAYEGDLIFKDEDRALLDKLDRKPR